MLEKKEKNSLEADIGKKKVYFDKTPGFFPEILKEIILLRKKYKQELKNSKDENAITITVVMYALGKIFNRSSYTLYKDWKIFYKITLESLENAEKKLINDDEKGYHENIKQILNVINKLSSNLKKYIQERI